MSCFKKLDQKLFTWVPVSSLEPKVAGTDYQCGGFWDISPLPRPRFPPSSFVFLLLSKFTQWNLMRIYLCKDLF